MTLGTVASGSAVWNHAGRVTEYVLFYLSSILVARALGVDQNGQYVSLLSLSQLLLVAASIGLEASLNTFIPRLSTEPSAAPRLRYLMRRLGGVRAGALLFALLVAGLIFAGSGIDPQRASAEPLLLIAGLTVVRALIALPVVALTALYRTRTTAMLNIAARLLELAAVLLLAGTGLTVSLWIAVLGGIATLQLAVYAVAAGDLWRGPVERTPLRPVLAFGFVFWMNTIVDYFLGRYGDIFFLTWLAAGPGEASAYDVAYSLVQVGMIGMTAGMSGVSLATFSRLAAERSGDLGSYYTFVVRLTSFLTIPLFGYIGFFAAPLVVTLYDTPFTGAVPVLQVMLVFRVTCRLFAGGENNDLLLVTGRVRSLLLANVLAAAVNILFNILLIPRFGAIGAAVAGGMGLLTSNAGGYLLVRRLVPVHLPVRNWLLLVGVSGVSGLSASQLPGDDGIGFVSGTLMYAVLMVGGMLLARPLSARDGEWLRRHAPGPLAYLSKFAESTP